jgi:GDP-L-fucose synthase
MNKKAKIYLAGHQGLVGSAMLKKLGEQGYSNLLLRDLKELNLRDQAAVNSFFDREKPEYVFLAAALVGGIHANNTYPADFIYDNLLIECNVIQAAYVNHVKKLLFLGSSCIYPRNCPQPMKEEYLLTGPLEPTNEPYAVAKIAGIKMCQAYNKQYGTKFISVMPTNLYGPNDNYHPENSHVLPALISRFHQAKTEKKPWVEAWGTGSPRREFYYSEDMAEACIYLMQNYEDSQIVNIGCGEDLTIKELTILVAGAVGYQGEIRWNTAKPDGMPQKLLDVSRLHSLGFNRHTPLEEGLKLAYQDFMTNPNIRK